jgi:lipopolysaccharide export system permease protein
MKLLSKYLVTEFLKLLVLCEAVFLFLYLMVDFLQKIDNFIEAQVPKTTMFLFFLYKAPLISVQMLPPATLIAAIILFSTMKKRNEITAIKACGLSTAGLAQKIVTASFLLGGFVFLFGETVVPYTSYRSNKIWNIEVEKQDPALFYGSHQIWYRGQNSIYWIRHFDFQKKRMQRPTFYFFDNDFRLTKRIDGQRAVWQDGQWRIEKGVIQERGPDGGYNLRRFESRSLDIEETPEAFVKGEKKPEEMSYWQLKRYAAKVREEGYDNTRYLVDMHIKTAIPFAGLVLALIGISIALRVEKGGTPLAISVGMAGCFCYVLTLGLSSSLGLSGVLPPLLSAWLANFVFLLLGIYSMMHVRS